MNNFDLEERCARFAEKIIALCKKIEITPINRRIIDQLVGSSGSIGANYCEASEAESRKDFRHKMSIAKKEIKETKHWLRLLSNTNKEEEKQIKEFWEEAHELLLIFSKSINTSKSGRD